MADDNDNQISNGVPERVNVDVGDTLHNGALVVAVREGCCGGRVVLCHWRNHYVTWHIDDRANAYRGHYFGASLLTDVGEDYATR